MEGSRLPAVIFISGVCLLVIALLLGEAKAGLFIIFPFVMGGGILSIAGIFLIFISMFLFIFSFDWKASGVVFVGPIPIVVRNGGWILIPILLIFFLVLIFILFFMLSAFAN